MVLREKIAIPLITGLSVLVPALVALLIMMPKEGSPLAGLNVSFLPLLNACFNGGVTVLLIVGFYFISKRNIHAHKLCMMSAFVLSCLFLVSYVAYRLATPGHTAYGGSGFMKGLYYFILITHLTLATAIVPMALLSIYRGLSERYDKHRKIARWTLPLWLYVSITGVIVYIMLIPYYPTT